VIVYLNGRFVPEADACVSVFDRSFQYGDGLFETLRVANGQPFRWEQHFHRFEDGARFLRIQLPESSNALRAALEQLLKANSAREAVARMALSRGVGSRGYSPKGADTPTLVLSVHPADPHPDAPASWRLFTSALRLHPDDPLAVRKTANKLIQVVARAEAEDQGHDEALLLNARDELCETASGNLFWWLGNRLHTPPIGSGLLPGVTRAVVMELAMTMGLQSVETTAAADALRASDGAFVTLSSRGMIEVSAVDDQMLETSSQTRLLYDAYRSLVASETGGGP
jgi:aminodeoxychorismate lyase